MTGSSTTQMVGVAISTLRDLRSAVITSADPDAAVKALREAGYGGGTAVHAAFVEWLAGTAADQQPTDTDHLPIDRFGELAGDFFRDAGWGDVVFSTDDDEGVAVVDIDGCWEATGSPENAPGCQVTTGLLAAFFGTIAGYPVAVLETECAAESGGRCHFLLGNTDVMNYKWEEMR
ncbi:MAG: V4R domain-containing protein [Gemmatimonadaceae bacterium]